MIALNIDDLRVDSFSTVDTGIIDAPITVNGFSEEEMQPLFAPITAHTDPCDVCCQQQ